MPPWRIQHESHTCSDLSLRILLWSASDVKNNPVTPDRNRRVFGVDWKENSFVAALKNGIKSIEARRNSEISAENWSGQEIHRSLRLRQLWRKINEKSPSSVHVLNSKILMWFSLKNGIMVFGLATPHHDSKIAGTFAQKLGWVFVGPCHPSAHGPPAKLRSFTSLQMVHTHTHTLKSTVFPQHSLQTHALLSPKSVVSLHKRNTWLIPFKYLYSITWSSRNSFLKQQSMLKRFTFQHTRFIQRMQDYLQQAPFLSNSWIPLKKCRFVFKERPFLETNAIVLEADLLLK